MSGFTGRELREVLGISHQRLSSLVRKGMPNSGANGQKRYDPDQVSQWLVDRGIATEETSGTPILSQRREVSEYFGVHLRTVAEWVADPTFPGRSSTKGRNDGFFPVDQIDKWIRTKQGSYGTNEDRSNLVKVRTARQELALQRELGQVVNAEEIARFIARTVSATVALLREIPDKLAATMPEEIDFQLRKKLREVAETAIKETCIAISELTTGDEDDIE